MKKIWSYIAVFFMGLSAGLVAMYKLTGDTVKIEIKKVKNKRISGIVNTTIPISVESPKNRRKRPISDRKEAKIIKRNQKKADRAQKKLENGGA